MQPGQGQCGEGDKQIPQAGRQKDEPGCDMSAALSAALRRPPPVPALPCLSALTTVAPPAGRMRRPSTRCVQLRRRRDRSIVTLHGAFQHRRACGASVPSGRARGSQWCLPTSSCTGWMHFSCCRQSGTARGVCATVSVSGQTATTGCSRDARPSPSWATWRSSFRSYAQKGRKKGNLEAREVKKKVGRGRHSNVVVLLMDWSSFVWSSGWCSVFFSVRFSFFPLRVPLSWLQSTRFVWFVWFGSPLLPLPLPRPSSPTQQVAATAGAGTTRPDGLWGRARAKRRQVGEQSDASGRLQGHLTEWTREETVRCRALINSTLAARARTHARTHHTQQAQQRSHISAVELQLQSVNPPPHSHRPSTGQRRCSPCAPHHPRPQPAPPHRHGSVRQYRRSRCSAHAAITDAKGLAQTAHGGDAG